MNVMVSASGGVDLDLPVFSSGTVLALIVTTTGGRIESAGGIFRRPPR